MAAWEGGAACGFPRLHHPTLTKERLEKALDPHYLRGADTNIFDCRCVVAA